MSRRPEQGLRILTRVCVGVLIGCAVECAGVLVSQTSLIEATGDGVVYRDRHSNQVLATISPLPYHKELYVHKGNSRKLPGVAVITQTSMEMDRLSCLETLTKTWPGVISASIYIDDDPESQTSSSAKRKVAQTIQGALGTVYITYIFKLPDSISPGTTYDHELPMNAMRNAALDAARESAKADVIFVLDVDYVPSTNLPELVEDLLPDLKKNPKVALMVAAFHNKDKHDERGPILRTKQELRDAGAVFHSDNDQVPVWWTNTKGNRFGGKASKVAYYKFFEPYVLANAAEFPRFDERFRKYGFDRMSQVHVMNAMGFEFDVIRDGFH